ncbi:MAG: GNAT family N-acetyltransferase [Hyphomicrobiales bacterium]|nr:GNAT family N-acetyltransferase [Hyphomicrobiales bacterium]MDE2018009.1 GNAT family N-acetyltransferase [Hyphomicrobiales bacterium]
MFSDISRDDVFLIETPRLWLRWPHARDADAIARACAEPSLALWTARIPHPYPEGEAEAFVARARAANFAGEGLTLVVTTKGDRRDLVGCVSVERDADGQAELGYWVARPFRGRGYASEAARRAISAAFRLTAAVTLVAKAHPDNVASRATLEGLGFVEFGPTTCVAPARGGAVEAVDHRLSRADWRESAAYDVAAPAARV